MPWSNISPCSTISASLAQRLNLEKLPLRRSRNDIAHSVLSSSLVMGEPKQQWFYVRELRIRLETHPIGDNTAKRNSKPTLKEVQLGPLLVFNEPICDLAAGKDFLKAMDDSISMSTQQFVFKSKGYWTPSYPMQYFDEDGNEVHGTCSWMWADNTDLETCAWCEFEFPLLKLCSGCRKTAYCSIGCQKQHWRQHKGNCSSKKKQNKKDCNK